MCFRPGSVFLPLILATPYIDFNKEKERKKNGIFILMTSLEHPSVLNACDILETFTLKFVFEIELKFTLELILQDVQLESVNTRTDDLSLSLEQMYFSCYFELHLGKKSKL